MSTIKFKETSIIHLHLKSLAINIYLYNEIFQYKKYSLYMRMHVFFSYLFNNNIIDLKYFRLIDFVRLFLISILLNQIFSFGENMLDIYCYNVYYFLFPFLKTISSKYFYVNTCICIHTLILFSPFFIIHCFHYFKFIVFNLYYPLPIPSDPPTAIPAAR